MHSNQKPIKQPKVLVSTRKGRRCVEGVWSCLKCTGCSREYIAGSLLRAGCASLSNGVSVAGIKGVEGIETRGQLAYP